MRVCYFCGTKLDDKLKVYRSSACVSCKKDLKICYNCRFYKKGAHMDCLESIAEPVRDKDRSNFCDYFRFKDSTGESSSKGQDKRAKEDFQKLFGNGL
jgi:hypothetical protein